MAFDRTIGRKNVFKKERFLIAILSVTIFGWFLMSAFPVFYQAKAYNKSSAIVLMNAESGEILYSENADEKMEIASTTKILTALCVIENNDVFSLREIPSSAVGVEGSSIYLQKGEK